MIFKKVKRHNLISAYHTGQCLSEIVLKFWLLVLKQYIHNTWLYYIHLWKWKKRGSFYNENYLNITLFLCLDVGKRDGKPFYFGTTDVACMRMIRTRRKRSLNASVSLPNRKFWSLTHRWIYYDGWYFELFYEPHTRRAAKTEKCPSRREAKPAGYTRLDIECVRRCADYYNERFTKQYNALTHNCHHYANKLAEIMCLNSSCPDWCTTIYLWRWWLYGDRQLEMTKPFD